MLVWDGESELGFTHLTFCPRSVGNLGSLQVVSCAIAPDRLGVLLQSEGFGSDHTLHGQRHCFRSRVLSSLTRVT